MYLSRFGYMNHTITNRAVLPEETVREAVMKFQVSLIPSEVEKVF